MKTVSEIFQVPHLRVLKGEGELVLDQGLRLGRCCMGVVHAPPIGVDAQALAELLQCLQSEALGGAV